MANTKAVTEAKGQITKPEFIKRCIANCEIRLTIEQMRIIHDTFAQVLHDLILEEQSYNLRGVGTFKCIRKPERTARNPATGETVTVKPNLALQFKPNLELKLQLKQTNPYAKKRK